MTDNDPKTIAEQLDAAETGEEFGQVITGFFALREIGKDDAGDLVGQGRYVINIEMTREHGGHSLQTIPLDLGKAPVSGAAPGQGESGPAAARYGRPAI